MDREIDKTGKEPNRNENAPDGSVIDFNEPGKTYYLAITRLRDESFLRVSIYKDQERTKLVWFGEVPADTSFRDIIKHND